MTGRTTSAIFALLLLAACAPAPMEEAILAEPAPVIAAEPAGDAAPSARKLDPSAECASGNDGIGGTGCPQID